MYGGEGKGSEKERVTNYVKSLLGSGMTLVRRYPEIQTCVTDREILYPPLNIPIRRLRKNLMRAL